MPLYYLLREKMKFWQHYPKLFEVFQLGANSGSVLGAKNRKPFLDFLSWCAAVMGGGYSVVIPRKQTCSLRLKPSLCRWGFYCPALSFSANCISHWQRLTGSFRFPCSTRIHLLPSMTTLSSWLISSLPHCQVKNTSFLLFHTWNLVDVL